MALHWWLSLWKRNDSLNNILGLQLSSKSTTCPSLIWQCRAESRPVLGAAPHKRLSQHKPEPRAWKTSPPYLRPLPYLPNWVSTFKFDWNATSNAIFLPYTALDDLLSSIVPYQCSHASSWIIEVIIPNQEVSSQLHRRISHPLCTVKNNNNFADPRIVSLVLLILVYQRVSCIGISDQQLSRVCYYSWWSDAQVTLARRFITCWPAEEDFE